MQIQQITTDVLLEKYAKGSETTEDEIFRRVAKGVALVESDILVEREFLLDEVLVKKELSNKVYWEQKFYQNMVNGALGAGRIMSAAGDSIQATWINCFIQPVGDSIEGVDEDGVPGIYEALKQSACTMRRGGGVGYNFSLIRPKGAEVKSVASNASGPCSYMDIFDASCKTIESAGSRRGAQLSALNIDHPDILDFIKAKRTPGRWNNFNVSVLVPDWFMEAKAKDLEINLVHKAKPHKSQIDKGAFQLDDGLWVYGKIKAIELWDIIMKSNYDYAEPGILFESNINNDNNLRAIEYINTTNPCVTGETTILTNKGDIRIDSLVDQEVVIWNGFEWSTVIPKVTGTDQQIIDFTFSNGSTLSCTPYHKFILSSGIRVEAKELNIDTELSFWLLPTSEYIDGNDTLVRTKMVQPIRVSSIKYRDSLEPQVYCFNEEKNHTGIFNGIMTAQCGEEPLPPYGCCDLGPINLTKFVKDAFTLNAKFEFEKFKEAVKIQVRFLDNVLDGTLWPLKEQKTESENKRRIGVGFTGLANALAMLGKVYYSEEGLSVAKRIVETMRDTAYEASVDLAIEREPFKLFNADQFLEDGTFASRLPDYLKDRIRTNGIRNSHLLSVAPTGTISLAFADNASNGIEPPFSLAYTRKKREADGSWKEYAVLDHSFRMYIEHLKKNNFQHPDHLVFLVDAVVKNQKTYTYENITFDVKSVLPEYFVTALEMTPSQHISMMKVVQPYIDASVSKTVNCPVDISFDSYRNIYDEAWKGKLKGISTYRPNNILGSILSVTETKEEPKPELKSKTIDKSKWKEDLKPVKTAKDLNPYELMIHKRPQGVLQSETDKISYYGYNGDYTFYISVSYLEMDRVQNGNTSKVQRPIEIFVTVSPTSLPVEWVTTYCRTMSKIARTSFAMFAETLQDNRSISSGQHPIRYDFFIKPDGTKVPRHHESDVAVISYAIQRMLKNKKLLDEDGNVCDNYNCIEETYLTQREVNSLLVSVTDESLLSQEDLDALLEGVTETVIPNNSRVINGKLCDKCGAHTVIKKDNCSFCTSCGEVGNCG